MQNDQREIISIATLNQRANAWLMQEPAAWLRVEIVTLNKPASGHLYFMLKDQSSGIKIPGVLTIREQSGLGFTPCVGDVLELHGKVELYQPRSQYQIKIDMMHKIEMTHPSIPSPSSSPLASAPPFAPKNSSVKMVLLIGGVIAAIFLLRALF